MKNLLKVMLSIFLAITLCVVSIGCGDNPDNGGTGDNPGEGGGTTTVEVVPPTYKAPSEIDDSDYSVFYFDGDAGSDANSGKHQLSPKKTIGAIAQLAQTASELNPIKILLKCGSTFAGNLYLSNYETTEKKPLIISSYGDLSKGRPKLVGSGQNTDTAYAVVTAHEDNVRISNLEITDPYAYQGIFFSPTKAGAMKNVVVENCYVHDVNFFWDEDKHDPDNPPDTLEGLAEICPSFTASGSLGRRYYRNYGGIVFSNATTVQIGASWYENLYAINNVIERVARTGIYVTTRWNNAPGVGYGENKFVDETERWNDAEKGIGYFIHKNVNFVDNKLDLIAGDGIILGAKDSVLQGNICYRANYLGCRKELSITGVEAAQYFNAAIWVYDANNVLFQNNEAGYTFLRNGGGDGEGFDIDNSCENVYFQYNYAHHNEGGGILVCNTTVELLRHDKDGNVISPYGNAESLLGVWGNNYIRNNLFVFNGSKTDGNRSAFLTVARECKDLYVYNNTVIFEHATKTSGSGITRVVPRSVITCEDIKASTGQQYFNNVFWLAQNSAVEPTLVSNNNLKDAIYKNNLYFNTGNLHNLFATPDDSAILNIDPQITIPTEFDGLDKIASFKGANSQLFQGGLVVDGMLEKDILGKKVGNIKYVGAFAG